MPKTTIKRTATPAEALAYFDRLQATYEFGDLTILGLTDDYIDALQEAGVRNIKELAEADSDELAERLRRGGTLRSSPSSKKVIELISSAQILKPECAWLAMIDLYHDRKAWEDRQRARALLEITLTSAKHGEAYLTVNYLESEVLPFIRALVEIQEVAEETTGGRLHAPIYGITRNSPITVSIDGVSEAIRAVQELITPWKRQHAERMARLAEQEAVVQTEKARAEVLEGRARAQRTRAEAEKLRLEIEREKVALEVERLRLAAEVLATFSPDLASDSKQVYVNRLLEPLSTISRSDLELTGKN